MQLIEKDMFDFVKAIAEKNDLQYILMGGTLLGCVRHHGFIPWDDDIDVGFDRIEYNRLLVILREEIKGTSYELITEFKSGYGMAFTKLLDTRYFIHEKNSNHSISDNVFIDIFPYDHVPDNKFRQKIQYRQFQFWNVGILVRLGFDHDRSRIAKFLLTCHQIILIPFSTNFMKHARLRVLTSFTKNRDTDVSNFSSRGFNKELVRREDITEFIKGNFENERVWIPSGYDQILTHMYGDYMQLPPEDDRIGRHSS